MMGMGGLTPYYEKASPELRVYFELFLAHAKNQELDYETLRRNYLKRSPDNKEEDLRNVVKGLADDNRIRISVKEVGGEKRIHYSFDTVSCCGYMMLEDIERLTEAAGFIKVIPKRYEILVE